MCKISYRRHRFPPIIIQHAVWLYCRFTLSYRDVEDLLAERGLDLSYETVRRWVLKFGRAYARRVQRRRPQPTERWHLDEMVVVIRGRRYFLWRAVDREGEVLDFLIQSRRNTKAAIRLMRKLLKKQGFAPSTIVTDKLRSYGSAIRKLGLCAEHEQGLRKNNRAENSHQPVVPSIYSIVPPNDGSALRHGHHFEPVDFVINHGRGRHDAYSAGSCQRTYARACGCRRCPRRHREELIESERGWSGREAFVTMMQTADLGQGNDRSGPGRLNGSSIRCVLAERQVGP